jgi:hypothetical protein
LAVFQIDVYGWVLDDWRVKRGKVLEREARYAVTDIQSFVWGWNVIVVPAGVDVYVCGRRGDGGSGFVDEVGG